MNPFNRTLFSIAGFLLITAQLLDAQEKIEIKPRWPLGKKLSMTMRMDQDSTVALGGAKIEQKLGMTMESTTSVRPHENGSHKRVHVVYDRIVMSVNAGGEVMNYDSAKAEGNPPELGEALDGIVGQEVKMVVNEKDELLDVENFEKLLKGVAADDPVTGAFGQMFSKDALRDMLRYATLYASPGKPVGPGEGWPFSYAMPMPQIGRLDIKGTYTFKRMAERGGVRCVEIVLNAKLGLSLSAPGTPANPALNDVRITLHDGKMSGMLWFDPALGVSRESRFTQEMTMKTKNAQQPEETLEIPMRQVITQTLLKVEDL